MKKTVITSALLAASMLIATPSMAKVEIEWKEYEDYSDIRPSNETRKRFARNTFKNIEKFMVKLMEDMPEGHTLSMTVTDLDLAGRVQPANFPLSVRGGGFIQLGSIATATDIRVIDGTDVPRMEFQFKLLDESGNVVMSGDEVIRDLGFLQRNPVTFRRRDRLRYEKQMIRDWFFQEFKELRITDEA